MSYVGDDDRHEAMDFEGERKALTDAAILLDVDGEEHWLPLSETDIEKLGGMFSKRVRFTIPRWLAEEKGLV